MIRDEIVGKMVRKLNDFLTKSEITVPEAKEILRRELEIIEGFEEGIRLSLEEMDKDDLIDLYQKTKIDEGRGLSKLSEVPSKIARIFRRRDGNTGD